MEPEKKESTSMVETTKGHDKPDLGSAPDRPKNPDEISIEFSEIDEKGMTHIGNGFYKIFEVGLFTFEDGVIQECFSVDDNYHLFGDKVIILTDHKPPDVYIFDPKTEDYEELGNELENAVFAGKYAYVTAQTKSDVTTKVFKQKDMGFVEHDELSGYTVHSSNHPRFWIVHPKVVGHGWPDTYRMYDVESKKMRPEEGRFKGIVNGYLIRDDSEFDEKEEIEYDTDKTTFVKLK
jgi:hypothetical protein